MRAREEVDVGGREDGAWGGRRPVGGAGGSTFAMMY